MKFADRPTTTTPIIKSIPSNKEKAMKTLYISIVLVIIIMLGGAAYATTPIIKLSVPVQLTTLNEGVEAIKVDARAYKANGQGGTMADGMVEIPCPADGNINQTVVVQLKQASGEDIREADTVSAGIWLKVNGVWKQPGTNENTPVEYRTKEGTQIIYVQHATIPW
jgi:hypothetical protein